MNTFDVLAAELLLKTGASRACFLRAEEDGRFVAVGEGVRDGLRQLRDVEPGADFRDHEAVESARQASRIVADNGTGTAAGPSGLLDGDDVRSRLLVPVTLGSGLAGVLVVEQAREPRDWSAADIEAASGAQARACEALTGVNQQPLPVRGADLCETSVQAILNDLRVALKAQRCTFRQDVVRGYAFAVAFESRGPDIRSLYGDFTIVQSSQPVIQAMLKTGEQVVQADCSAASGDPLFHAMLEHYGGMRSQIVTPWVEKGTFMGALSVHDLRGTRTWTSAETTLAREATRLVAGLLSVQI